MIMIPTNKREGRKENPQKGREGGKWERGRTYRQGTEVSVLDERRHFRAEFGVAEPSDIEVCNGPDGTITDIGDQGPFEDLHVGKPWGGEGGR